MRDSFHCWQTPARAIYIFITTGAVIESSSVGKTLKNTCQENQIMLQTSESIYWYVYN